MNKKKINVIHIITELAIGGATENTIITASSLNRRKFNTIIVSGKEEQNDDLVKRVKQEEIPYFVNKNLCRLINPARDLLCLLTLTKFIREHKGIVVHTHSSKAGIIGRIAAFLAGSTIIIHTVHGWSFHQYWKRWEMYIFILLERFVARFTDRIVCVTTMDILKGLASNIGRINQYGVIRSGFDIKKFQGNKDTTDKMKKQFDFPLNQRIVGTVGRLSQQKDPETFVNVAHLVSKIRKDVIFVFVGEGELRKKTDNLIQHLKMEKYIYLLGAQKNVEKIFPLFDVFLLTSLWEGLPKVIPQAMASGIPIVSTAVDGVKEVIKNETNGYLSKPGDAESLAENVIKLLNDKEKSRRFVYNSKRLIKQFDSKLMVKQIERTYSDLISKKT